MSSLNQISSVTLVFHRPVSWEDWANFADELGLTPVPSSKTQFASNNETRYLLCDADGWELEDTSSANKVIGAICLSSQEGQVADIAAALQLLVARWAGEWESDADISQDLRAAGC